MTRARAALASLLILVMGLAASAAGEWKRTIRIEHLALKTADRGGFVVHLRP